MNPHDFAIFKQIEEWTDSITGYPMVSGFEEFTYEPDKPLCGDLSAFAFAQRGAVAMVCELWDFWKQAGLPVHRPFVHSVVVTGMEATSIGEGMTRVSAVIENLGYLPM
ncbi:MAG: hypothetical protein ABI134_21135, partial [Byssovorax sp.]